MVTLLQVSDTHFGTERPHVISALRDLAEREHPDVLVWSGDVTQRARRAQFERARDLLQAVRAAHVVAIPGNHDIPLFDLWTRLWSPYRQYVRVFGADLEPTVDLPRLLVLGVNTTRWYRHKHGEISVAQIERVARRLQTASPGQLRIVVVHQPVFVVRTEDRRNLLRGHEQAIATWAAAGVDLILGGHIHLPYVRSLRGSLPNLTRDLWTVQAGTAVSSRIREGIPNSVNIVRTVDAAGGCRRCVVERWDFERADARFACRETHQLGFNDDRVVV